MLTPAQTLTALLVCLTVWTAIASPALYRNALASHPGARRRAVLDILAPIRRTTALLSIDRISRAADDVRGRSGATHPAALRLGPVPPSAPVTPAVANASLRVPTAADPLRVLVIGDSLGLSFGQSVAARLDASGVTRTTVDAREGTGLVRPDSFDWGRQLDADIVRFHPEVVIASFGGNDDQDILVSGHYLPFGSAPWQAVYRQRVGQIVAEVAAGRARLVWSGLPIMRSATKSARFATVMTATRSVVVGRPLALWVGNAATLADATGHYEAALSDGGGTQVMVREPDGIHETRAGADRLADRTIAAMVSAWHLQLKPGPH